MRDSDAYEQLISDDLMFLIGQKLDWKGCLYGKEETTVSTEKVLGEEKESEKA
jgi:hypothetical protein